MESFNVINQTVESDFACRSLSEFFDSSNKEYSKLLGALQEVATVEDYDADNLDQYIEDVMRQYDLHEDQLITLNRGFARVGQALKFVCQYMDMYASNPNTTYNALELRGIDIYDKDGAELALSYSITELMDEVKSNYEATVATAAALWAAAYPTASDRLQVFTNKFTSYLSESSISGSSVAVMFRNKLMEPEFSSGNMINWLSSALGVNSRVENESAVDLSDIRQYTGCNPIATADFSYAGKVATATGRVIVTAVAGMFNLLRSGVQWAADKVYQTVINPVDLYVTNNVGNNTIDGWSIDEHDSYTFSSSELDEVAMARDLVGRWFKFDNIFGEMLFSLKEYDGVSPVRKVDGVSKVRLKPVRPEAIDWSDGITGYNLFQYNPSTNTFGWNLTGATPNMVLSCFSNIRNYGDWRPRVESDGESYMHMCYKISAHLLFIYLYCMRLIVDQKGDDEIPGISTYSGVITKNQTVTNADFVQVASGWNKSTSNPSFSWVNIVDGFITPVTTGSLTWHLIPMLCKQQVARYNNPLNYVFLPYLKDIESFSAPTYRIRTDEENSEAFNKFLTIVVTVVVVAAIAVSAALIAKSISRSLFFKRTSFMSKCDQKLMNGEKLSILEQSRYIRLKRKLNAFALLNGGLGLDDVARIPSLDVFNNEPNYSNDIRELTRLVEDGNDNTQQIKDLIHR